MPGPRFWKFYAEGNVYVVVDDTEGVDRALPTVADPGGPLAADGVLLRQRTGGSSFAMRVFNADGSEAPMCGNGARCIAALGVLLGETIDHGNVEVSGAGGVIMHRLEDPGSLLMSARMSLPEHPILHACPSAQQLQLIVGTPHLVVFADLGATAVEREGPSLERSRKGGTNVMFTAVSAAGKLKVLPWERGVGAVGGCATGAAAAVIAAAATRSSWPRRTHVYQPGGELEVEWDPQPRVLIMRGRVELISEGRLSPRVG